MVSEIDTINIGKTKKLSLNPCCSGIWFLSIVKKGTDVNKSLRLNPCCSGIWFLSAQQSNLDLVESVLILVVVEYGF